ncbi:assembly of actin patch protein [Diaporthe australafricana]|uniref:Assembly of actin patch protein n=1 Tax=Diaporthe australafricana TaxID=127596 RepID=A0ABR3Y449_9PEZI
MPYKVKALYEYSSPHDDDLNFPLGQVITVTEEEDDDWYTGEYLDEAGAKHEGIFPRNFVEKYEPVAPPRPTRTRTKKEPEPASEEIAAAPEEPAPPAFSPKSAAPEPAPASYEEDQPVSPPRVLTEPRSPIAAAPRAPEPAEPETPASPPRAPAAEPAAQSPPKAAPAKKGPPPVSQKPASNAFKDRIAAFNKSSAPPVAPFKPSGLGGASGASSFIKKPFVAPPPKGNTYVPVQRNTPVAPVYRRDEDPEIREREAENEETAQKAGLLPTESNEGDEDQPKPLSLKERMALLQRQQQEQAQRHADAAAKREKPKRPAKPRMPSHEPGATESVDEEEAAQPPPLDRTDTGGTGGRASIDESHPPRVPAQPRRKPSKGPEPRDGNEADMSGAGETTEDQADLTEREDSDEKPRRPSRVATEVAPAEEEAEEDEEEEEEEDEEAKEFRRKEELRARMARLGGGMGMPGMFGMPALGGAPSLPPKKKKASTSERRPSEDSLPLASPGHAPPVPMMMPLPGLGGPRKSEDRTPMTEEPPAVSDEEDEPVARSPPAARPPPPAPVANLARSEGSESDDELSGPGALETPRNEEPPVTRAPPPLPPVSAPAPPVPTSPRMPTSPKYHGDDSTPVSPSSKRASRPPPPVPGTAAAPPSQTRPPPPPPPGGLPRTSISSDRPGSSSKPSGLREDSNEGEITEYDGDYDTDIASSVPHKDALKSHGRESSIEDTISVASPKEAPPSLPPPIPSAAAPRAVPPPPPVPSQPPPDTRPDTRRSVDAPRAAPPPPPPTNFAAQDDDYDPYNYTAAPTSPPIPPAPAFSQPPPPPPPRPENDYEEMSYQPQSEHRATPTASVNRPAPTSRGSLDVRASRRSVDMLNRPSMESGFVANDVDLAPQSGWWSQPKGLPPQLQGRKDLFFESDESQTKTTVTRDIYVLFQDYSQTVITARFNPQDPKDVQLEQRHEGPPRSLRQDQLEESYERFGRPLSTAVAGKKDSVVGDGTPQSLVLELLKPFKDALLPVGTRAYGALVYSNLANASTTQTDQIRPGDIISIRNAKFQGKHGPMHAKYSMEVGKPDHVGVVAEWDGTKKKVRAWEQGRESKKVKQESFKLDDLRSGEVKIWRVMPRSWVGWEGQN